MQCYLVDMASDVPKMNSTIEGRCGTLNKKTMSGHDAAGNLQLEWRNIALLARISVICFISHLRPPSNSGRREGEWRLNL